MTPEDKDYPNIACSRTIKYILDDGTVLAVVATGLLSEPRIRNNEPIIGYKVNIIHKILYTPKENGPPGNDFYTNEELEAHTIEERQIVKETEAWNGDRRMIPVSQVGLVRIWETDLFNKDGEPAYRLEYKHPPEA